MFSASKASQMKRLFQAAENLSSYSCEGECGMSSKFGVVSWDIFSGLLRGHGAEKFSTNGYDA